MSDDFFDEFDSEPLDAEFFQQVDTLEQVALSQHPRAAAKPPPSKRQKLDNGQAHGIEGSYGLPEHERPSMVQQRLAAEGDHESADLAAQWERALANLESENARVRWILLFFPMHTSSHHPEYSAEATASELR